MSLSDFVKDGKSEVTSFCNIGHKCLFVNRLCAFGDLARKLGNFVHFLEKQMLGRAIEQWSPSGWQSKTTHGQASVAARADCQSSTKTNTAKSPFDTGNTSGVPL